MIFYLIFGIAGLFFKKRFPYSKEKARFAVVVAARNEENVICNLINSIRNCDYPREKIDIFVIYLELFQNFFITRLDLIS